MNRTDPVRYGRFTVLPSKIEVQWKDGTRVDLFGVLEDGVPSKFHRCAMTPGGLRIVFDLRKVCPSIAVDMLTTQARDVPGLVFYSLRQHLTTSAELLLKISTQFDCAWLPSMEEVAA